MRKLILGMAFVGIGIFCWGKSAQSFIIQLCGFGLVAAMFTIFMAKRRHS